MNASPSPSRPWEGILDLENSDLNYAKELKEARLKLKSKVETTSYGLKNKSGDIVYDTGDEFIFAKEADLILDFGPNGEVGLIEDVNELGDSVIVYRNSKTGAPHRKIQYNQADYPIEYRKIV